MKRPKRQLKPSLQDSSPQKSYKGLNLSRWGPILCLAYSLIKDENSNLVCYADD